MRQECYPGVRRIRLSICHRRNMILKVTRDQLRAMFALSLENLTSVSYEKTEDL